MDITPITRLRPSRAGHLRGRPISPDRLSAAAHTHLGEGRLHGPVERVVDGTDPV
ncbi:hypothetical protein FHR32_004858 [Streptosporangium album]|uniref:Uncharacterized protein n=1 Tax=Streptosporangium album TaxID=47479 RepID=A0A7W7S026_9ACTN|nr:hypothetical protein [Streptosporangium album]